MRWYKVVHALTVSAVAVFTTGATTVAPVVDLGYARYQGYHDSASGLNVWKG